MHIGGWSASNDAGISRIRNSNDNLHLDAGSAGNLYLNHYCTGNVLIRGNTAWHAGNDGSGSGLDADLLDGIQAAGFVKQLSDSTTGPNYLTPSSRRVDPNAANPTNEHHAISTFGNGGNVSGQLATHYVNGQAYTRGYNTAWSAWRKQWDSLNDGSGSGLDADTVDGLQAASFLRSDANDVTSGNLQVTGATYGGISIGEANTNYDGWNRQLNIHGTSHARVNVKTANVRMGIYAHDSWHSGFAGHVGTYTNHPLSFICNAAQKAVLTTAGSLSTTTQGTLWGTGNDGSGSGLDADNLDGSTWTTGVNAKFNTIKFTGEGGNSGNGVNNYAIYQEGGAWSSPFPDLVIGFHTGIKIGGYKNYNGTRFYSDAPGRPGAFELMSIGNGDNHIRVAYNLYRGGNTVWDAGNDGSGSGLDADTVDGIQGGSFIRSDADDTITGKISVGSTSSRRAGMYGLYDSYKIGHIWSMGTAYQIPQDGASFGSLYGAAYTYHNRVYTSNSLGGGHQMVWCQNGTPNCALGSNLWTSGNVTAYSDIRVKTNIEVIPDALEKVKKLSGYTFDRTDVKDEETGNPIRQTGVIAQEVLEVLPEAVTGSEDSHYNVAYGNMVGLLIEAIKEQQAQIEELKEKLK